MEGHGDLVSRLRNIIKDKRMETTMYYSGFRAWGLVSWGLSK